MSLLIAERWTEITITVLCCIACTTAVQSHGHTHEQFSRVNYLGLAVLDVLTWVSLGEVIRPCEAGCYILLVCFFTTGTYRWRTARGMAIVFIPWTGAVDVLQKLAEIFPPFSCFVQRGNFPHFEFCNNLPPRNPLSIKRTGTCFARPHMAIQI